MRRRPPVSSLPPFWTRSLTLDHPARSPATPILHCSLDASHPALCSFAATLTSHLHGVREGNLPPTSGAILGCSNKTSWRYLNATDTLASPLTRTTAPLSLFYARNPVIDGPQVRYSLSWAIWYVLLTILRVISFPISLAVAGPHGKLFFPES